MYIKFQEVKKCWKGYLEGKYVERWYIDWVEHELTNIEMVNEQFSLGKAWHNGWVLFHAQTSQAMCVGLKRNMKALAKELLTYDHDVATATWIKREGTVNQQIRSFVTLTPERTLQGATYREWL
jgi:hypothetical protein